MDPDELLANLRSKIARRNEACELWNESDDPDEGERMDDLANEACHDMQALDEWLSKGGFLPTDWAGKQDALVRFVRDLANAPIQNGSSEGMLRRLTDIRNAAIALLVP